MNLATINIPEAEARAKLAEYEKVLVTERNAEDEAIAQGYRAAARGLQVIRLTEVIAAGGWHDNGLPRLAVSRADATECHVSVERSQVLYGDHRWPRNFGALVGAHTVRVPIERPSADRWSRWSGVAPVPLVPPNHRPKRPRLRNCHVLWEVDQWTPLPARDPALLRHIRGDLWAVLAVWDLTDLERAVLAQRSA